MKLRLFLFLAFPFSASAVSYSDVAPILRSKCAVCHRGPALSLETYPLHSDGFPTSRALAGEILRRIHLDGWKRMPPANGKPLLPAEMGLLDAWLRAGMPAR